LSSGGSRTSHSPARSQCRRAAAPTRSGSDRAKAGRPPGLQGRGRSESAPSLSILRVIASTLSALTEQLKQQHEKIYEVERERQRTAHCLLTCDFSRVRLEIHLLDTLRVVCGKAHEYNDADDGDGELKSAWPNKD